MCRATDFRSALLLVLSLGILAGCDRMVMPRHAQFTEQADAKSAEGKYLEAINLYEAALDGSEKAAEVHYKLGLLYDDKMNDPLNALHHFKRFLTITPTGKRAEEVKRFMKRDELTLLTARPRRIRPTSCSAATPWLRSRGSFINPPSAGGESSRPIRRSWRSRRI